MEIFKCASQGAHTPPTTNKPFQLIQNIKAADCTFCAGRVV